MTELARLEADITALPPGLTTREMYREACALMFFRYGITPTANKLHTLVKRGSMSTPVDVLRQFWEDLREKSRVRIDGGDLPEELVHAGGELLGTLWKQARTSAAASFEEREGALQAKEAEHSEQLKAARSEHEKLETALAHRTENLLALQVRLQDRENELAEALTREAALESEILELKSVVNESQRARAEEGRQFAERLEALARAGQEVEHRAAAAEKRALLEIDRERTQSTRLQKELDGARASALKAGEQSANREAALRQELETSRQRVATAETAVAVQDAGRTALEQEVRSLRSETVDLKVQLARSRADLTAIQQSAGAAPVTIGATAGTPKTARDTTSNRANHPRRDKKPPRKG